MLMKCILKDRRILIIHRIVSITSCFEQIFEKIGVFLIFLLIILLLIILDNNNSLSLSLSLML